MALLKPDTFIDMKLKWFILDVCRFFVSSGPAWMHASSNNRFAGDATTLGRSRRDIFMAVFRLERPSMDACRLVQQIPWTGYHIRPLKTHHMCFNLHACGFTIFTCFFAGIHLFQTKEKKSCLITHFFTIWISGITTVLTMTTISTGVQSSLGAIRNF